MNFNDASALLAQGISVRLEDITFRPGDTISTDFIDRADFVEVGEETEQIPDSPQPDQEPQGEPSSADPVSPEPEPASFLPDSQPQGNIKMIAIPVKGSRLVDIKGKLGNDPADVLLVTKITCSDPASALPVGGDMPEVIGIKEATGLTLEVEGVIKGKDGCGIRVSGKSNPFDVVPADQDMVPALDENGQPMPKIDPVTGEAVIDPLTGAPVIMMIPAQGALNVEVQAS